MSSLTSIPAYPFRIAITGSRATGKSTIANELIQNGIPVEDTDHMVHEILNRPDVQKQLVQLFGPTVVDSQTSKTDRKILGGIVFADDAKKKQLELLIHPLVAQTVDSFFNDPQKQKPIMAVLVPQLFESKTEHRYHQIWAVVVKPIETLIKRLMAREGITEDRAKLYLSKQVSQEEKEKRSNVVIDNSGTVEQTKNLVRQAIQDLKAKLGQPTP